MLLPTRYRVGLGIKPHSSEYHRTSIDVSTGSQKFAADECECRDILTTVGNFNQLALKVADIGLKDVALTYFGGEKVVVVLLGLLARGILSEEHISYLLKIVERMWGKRIELIRGTPFRLDGKVRHNNGSLREWTTILSWKCLMC